MILSYGAQFHCSTVLEATQRATRLLVSNCSSEDICKGTKAEVLGASFLVESPRFNLIASRARKFNYRYQIAEALWNLSSSDETAILAKVFPGVTRFVADQPKMKQNAVRWAYGPQMKAGMPFIVKELRKDPTSRRAVITMHHPADDGVEGTPQCLTSVQWIVREGELTQLVTMRSNDVYRGLPVDMYQFTMWQLALAAHLDLRVGPYHHYAGSLHLYAHDLPAARAFVEDDEAVPVKSTSPDKFGIEQVLLDEVLFNLREAMYLGFMRPTFTGWQPWFSAYHGDYANSPKEIQWLIDNAYGSGW